MVETWNLAHTLGWASTLPNTFFWLIDWLIDFWRFLESRVYSIKLGNFGLWWKKLERELEFWVPVSGRGWGKTVFHQRWEDGAKNGSHSQRSKIEVWDENTAKSKNNETGPPAWWRHTHGVMKWFILVGPAHAPWQNSLSRRTSGLAARRNTFSYVLLLANLQCRGSIQEVRF